MREVNVPRKSFFAAYAIIFALFFAESTFFQQLTIAGARPELLLVAVIFFGFHYGILRGAEAGIVSGLLKDLSGISPFGVNTFLFLSVGIIAGFLRHKLSRENPIAQFVFSFFGVYFIATANFFVLIDTMGGEASAAFWRIALAKGVYTAILAPFLFLALTKFFNPERS